MEDIRVELKPKKKHFIDKIKDLFEDKKKRALFLILFILPFLIAIGFFGFVVFKEAKNIINLATGTEEVKDEYVISSKGYVLRDNATDYQKELFAELKQAIEVDNADNATIVSLVCKNYVADFYTWTNKQGQYDIGGMYYVYNGEFEDGTHFRENVYSKARDSFYKYLSNHIKDYGAENLLEVQNIEVTKCSRTTYDLVLNEHVENRQDENGEWYDYREDHEYEAYDVTCVWTYAPSEKFDTSKYTTKMNFVVLADGSIIAADEKEIDVRKVEEVEEIEEAELDSEDE